MKLKMLVVAGLLAGLASVAYAGHDGDCNGHEGKGRDEGKQTEMFQKHQTELHDKLKLTAAQESAWEILQTKIKPEARDEKPSQAEFDKLTTPERIDRMQGMHKERQAHMETIGTATKDFYAQLNANQKKVFDENAFPRHMREHRPE
jgi:periplasmic protein CpxP/Spy